MSCYEYPPGSFGAEKERIFKELRKLGWRGRLLAWHFERKMRRQRDEALRKAWNLKP